jgi:hypothetical protein
MSLLAVQLVAGATLLRSIAFDRWITVLASILLIVGALAAQRGRAWGIGLTFATAVSFPVAYAIGIAPAWFCLVGLVGALPFATTVRPFARFDKGATALLALLTATGGAAVAMAWKEIAFDLFYAFPSLRPSGSPQHGLALLATLAVVGVAVASRSRAQSTSGEARLRIGEHVRVSEAPEAEALDDVLDDTHESEERESRRATRRA